MTAGMQLDVWTHQEPARAREHERVHVQEPRPWVSGCDGWDAGCVSGAFILEGKAGSVRGQRSPSSPPLLCSSSASSRG